MTETRSRLSRDVEIEAEFDEAIERVSEALATSGFGVLTRVDLHRAFQDKLGVETPPAAILGACRPDLAYRALTDAPDVALLLPCNVVVERIGPGRCRARFVDPRTLLGAVPDLGGPALSGVASEAAEAIDRAADHLERSASTD